MAWEAATHPNFCVQEQSWGLGYRGTKGEPGTEEEQGRGMWGQSQDQMVGDSLSPEAGVELTCAVLELAVPELREGYQPQKVAQDVHHGGDKEQGRQEQLPHPGRPRIPLMGACSSPPPAWLRGPPTRLTAVGKRSLLRHLRLSSAALQSPLRPFFDARRAVTEVHSCCLLPCPSGVG